MAKLKSSQRDVGLVCQIASIDAGYPKVDNKHTTAMLMSTTPSGIQMLTLTTLSGIQV
jgi:hypothetical protein